MSSSLLSKTPLHFAFDGSTVTLYMNLLPWRRRMACHETLLACDQLKFSLCPNSPNIAFWNF